MNSKKNSTLAIPFISFNEGKGFKLSDQAEQYLMSLPENRKLGIVSIVGKYRTGKSFFVNRVLLDQKKGGFQVGPTINPCTKGLWLWKKTIQSPQNEEMDIIMIDTQGFGGMDQNANHDSRIFLFSLLLSSFFIYNSVGSIDENALNTLNLIINLAKDIQTKTNNCSEDAAHFPSFLWVVRDFTLQIVDKNGQKITSKEYLQNALQFQDGASTAITNKNKIRKLLKTFFTNRDCETMVRPVEKEKDLQRLDEMDNSQLRPEFVTKVKFIRDKVFKSVKAKKINGRQLNGHLLVALCKGYMQAINKGMCPNVQSAWYYVCRSEGIKAIQQATNFLQAKVQELLKQPLTQEQLIKVRDELKKTVLDEFKKKSMGSEDGHPDLLQKLQRKIEINFEELSRKNKTIWTQKYRQKTDRYNEIIRDKIFREEFENFSDFVTEFETFKEEYDSDTQGANSDKWVYFNQISEQLYKLAGQTITNKINQNLETEKNLLEQKVKMQTEQIEQKHKKINEEKVQYKSKIEELQINNARLIATEETNSLRLNQYKEQFDKLNEKHRKLQKNSEQKELQLEKLKRQIKKINSNEIQQAKNEVGTLKSNMQKERTLFEMEKKYFQEEVDRYKERCTQLEGQNKKMRSMNSKMSSDLQELQVKFEEKEGECQMLEETNNSYSKKIQHLLAENSKKSELMGEHNEWLLQKAYLENQINFLKNTIHQNKKLNDGLLIALQQALASSQGENNNELIEANKNMSIANEKLQQRYKILEEKYDKVRHIKKLFKNCTAMQCCHCNKWVQSSTFSFHLEECGQNTMSIRQKTLPDLNMKQNIHISVSQNVIKQGQDKKKSYIEYMIQISTDEKKWKIKKQYRQFTELNQILITKFPSLKFPQSFNLLVESKNLMSNKKNTIMEERRKNIQHCLRDLAKIQEIQQSHIFRQFLQFDK